MRFEDGRIVRKKEGKEVDAWQLGTGSLIEEQLIEQGKIEKDGDKYYLVSTEVVEARKNGENARGEEFSAGDFFKVDGHGNPYGNEEGWFLENHINKEGDKWEQIPKPLYAYKESDGVDNDAIKWLVDNGKLQINENDDVQHYSAELWGTTLNAKSDATVVFYGVKRDEETKEIVDVDFNFVEAEEFDRTYDVEKVPEGAVEAEAEKAVENDGPEL